ncbi:MAG: hypothetical protein ACRDTC_25415 [Pseudonocardiaceae bacterium]
MDECRLLVFPVIVGESRRLFPDRGVATHIYRPGGRPEFGSI